jgi:hypothetical protein
MNVVSGILLLGHGINNDTSGGGLDTSTAFRCSMVAADLAQATLLACRNLLWLLAHTDFCAGWPALVCMLRTSCRCCGTGGEEISAIEAEVNRSRCLARMADRTVARTYVRIFT